MNWFDLFFGILVGLRGVTDELDLVCIYETLPTRLEIS
jgi:hypothetical protein